LLQLVVPVVLLLNLPGAHDVQPDVPVNRELKAPEAQVVHAANVAAEATLL
jgi:hypothetical protein